MTFEQAALTGKPFIDEAEFVYVYEANTACLFWLDIASERTGTIIALRYDLPMYNHVQVTDWFEDAPEHYNRGIASHKCRCSADQVLRTMEGCICKGY